MPLLTWLNCHGHFPQGSSVSRYREKTDLKEPPPCAPGQVWPEGARSFLFTHPHFRAGLHPEPWEHVSGPSAPLPHQGNTDMMTCTH